jgi:K+-transporting ATPase ATPase A chain
MNTNSALQLVLYIALLVALAVPLGGYMARVYSGNARFSQRTLGPLERSLYRLSGVNAHEQMTWTRYAAALLVFNLAGAIVVYAMQRLQSFLPMNPAAIGAVNPVVSFNTAVSFATNTNWQAYSGETTLSYLTQMLGLTVQNFVSAATGMAVLIALIRGFTGRTTSDLGSFWVDLTRSTLYILLPLSTVLALLVVSQGVVQTFAGPVSALLLSPLVEQGGKTITDQVIALGPAASQIAIKQLGTNGGGILQYEFRASLREPDALDEPARALGNPTNSCSTLLHVRRLGEGQAPGVGHLRSDAGDLPAAARGHGAR